MSESSKDYDEFSELLSSVADRRLTDEESARLASLLRESSEFRNSYLDHVFVHSLLCQRGGLLHISGSSTSELPLMNPQDKPRLSTEVETQGEVPPLSDESPVLSFLGGVSSFVSRPAMAAALVAVVVIPLGLAMLGVLPLPFGRPHDIAENSARSSAEQSVAQVTGLTPDCRWRHGSSEWSPRAELKTGDKLELSTGLAQIRFADGTEVILQGPSDLEVLTAGTGFLKSGKLTAKVPERAKGFAVETPAGRVVDLGTEFGLEVVDGNTLVSVFEGQVEVDNGASNSNSARKSVPIEKRKLTTGQTVRIHTADGKIEKLPDSETRFVRRMPKSIDSDLIEISPEYVAAVKSSKPFAYWRFESDAGNIVPNEMSDRYPLQVVGKVTLEAVGKDNRVALFGDNMAGNYRFERYLATDGPIEELKESDYSVELWVHPERFAHQSLASFFVSTGSSGASHCLVIELMSVEHRHHRGKSLRFNHRWPSEAAEGTNLVSNVNYTPGSWQHITVVKRDADIQMYLNGEQVGKASDPTQFGVSPGQILLGKLSVHRSEDHRTFYGRMDEVAIYQRALSTEEVRQHHVLGRPVAVLSE